MLKSLSVQNYALISVLEVNIQNGLSIITGETGAGKSILLGAIGLLTGKRAESEVLLNKDIKCVVEGVFILPDESLKSFFIEQNIDFDKETIIRREISPSGKSRAFVNDSPVNLNVLKELGIQLIDIHSQHENQMLNSNEFQIRVLDHFSGQMEQINQYQTLFKEYKEIVREIIAFQEEIGKIKEEIDFLTFQFDELSGANLKPDEYEALESEYDVLSHAEEIKINLGYAIQRLSEDEPGILDQIKDLVRSIEKIESFLHGTDQIPERIRSLEIELEDISAALYRINDKAEANPERLNVISERLNLLNSLLTKYRVGSIEELILIKNQVEEKLDKISFSEDELKSKTDSKTRLEAELNKMVKSISEKRKKIIPVFENQINTLLRKLMMPNAQFKVKIENTQEFNNFGGDEVSYLFSANNPEHLREISKVASGGEMSRFMLSLKSVIATQTRLPAIIFDEIDSGVSGEVAHKMGEIIKDMSNQMQVISITHLPQIAALGAQHFKVFKLDVNGAVTTQIKQLNFSEREFEIAQMISGEKVTDISMQNAKELLKQNIN